MELPTIDKNWKAGRGKTGTSAVPVLASSTSGSVPLWSQPVDPKFVTHESLTGYPDQAIKVRIERALTVAKLAAPLIRKGMPTEEACQRARDHLDWNEPLDVD